MPEPVLLTLLLPTVHYLRDLSRPGPDPGAGLAEREIFEQEAARAGEAAAAATRGAFLRAWAEHVREALEHEANAWRPRAADREVALDLWQRMEPLTPDEREVLLRYGTDFHSWALAVLGRALRETGEIEGAREADGEAERLWAAGAEEPGLLSEERFRAALGAAKPG